MKFSADREELKGKLKQVGYGVAGKYTTLPVLSHVLLKAQSDRLELRTTNMETGIQVSMSVVVAEEGACTVPFARLAKWVAAPLPKDTVKIGLTEKEGMPLSLRAQCGRNYCNFKGLFSEDEMPVARDAPVMAIVSAVDLIEAIQAVEWAVMPERSATKIVCTGILLEVYEDEVRLVTMDGFNAALYDFPARRVSESGDSVVVNRHSMEAVAGIVSGDVQICLGEGFVSFKTDSVVITGTTIEGAFPDYESYFADAEKGDKIWQVSKHEFVRLLKLVAPFAKSPYTSPFIEVEMSDVSKTVTVDGSTVGVGDCVGSVQAKGADAIAFAVGPTYIKKAVDSIVGEELVFVLRDVEQPYLLKPTIGDRHKIVMSPMRVTR